MRTRILPVAALLLATVALDAQAQTPFRPFTPPGPRSPAWSPYLNLFRRGNSAAFNYFSLVRPELEFRKNFGQIQQQFGQVQRKIDTAAQQTETPSQLPPTGHVAGFMTHSRYFMNLGGSGITRGAVSGGGVQLRSTSNRRNIGGRFRR